MILIPEHTSKSDVHPQRAFRMYGLELVESAVEDAQYNATFNDVGNADFLVGNCEHTLPSIFSSVNGLKIKAVVDPPRAGLCKCVYRCYIDSP